MKRRVPARALERRFLRATVPAVAALGLVGLSVFGGTVLSASAVPGKPTITGPVEGDPWPETVGVQFNVDTAGFLQDVEVYVAEVGSPDSTTPYCAASTIGSDDSATCTGAPLAPGNYTSFAIAADSGDTVWSPQSDRVGFTVFDFDPGLIGSGPADNSTDVTPTFAGSGPAMGTVTLSPASGDCVNVPVDKNNQWSCTWAATATDAPNSVTLTSAFLTGAAGTGGTWPTFTLRTPALATISDPWAPYNPWTTVFSDEAVSGTKDANTEHLVVEVSPTGTGGWTVYCDLPGLSPADTTWECPSPTGALAAGKNYLRTTSYNEVGGLTMDGGPAYTQIAVIERPTLDSAAPTIYTQSSSPVLTGAATGDSVSIGGDSALCTGTVVDGGPETRGTWSCDLSQNYGPLSEGEYVVNVYASPGNGNYTDYFSVIIDHTALAPVMTSGGATTDRTPTITGTGEAGATITVYINGGPVACVGGTVVADSGGSWSCQVAQSLDIDAYAISARQVDLAGNISATSAAVTLSVVLPEAPARAEPTPSPTPAPAQTPFTWRLDGTGSGEVHPGDEVILSARDLPPGLTVEAEFHSIVVKLGSTTVGQGGSFTLPVTVPLDAVPGLHHFVVTVWTPSGQAVVVEQAVTVVPVAKELAPMASIVHLAPGGLSGASADRSDPGAPSSFTHGIVGVGFLIANPVVLCFAALAALALFLLVAFPAELLNSTISEQYSRFSLTIPRTAWLRRLTGWLDSMPLLGGIAITLVAAFIFGFADPGFGFDIISFRLVLSCAIALFIVGYVASAISGRILGGRWKLSTTMELKPLGLILTVAGVVLSRLLDFSPGFLLGLILGLSLVGRSTLADRAKSTLVQAGVVFGLSIVGWLVYSALSSTMNPDEFGTALLFDTLVALTAEGLTAVFIGMLPFKFLDGPAVFDYSKKLWLAAFLVSAFAFVAIVIPGAWGELQGSVMVWASVVGAFAVVALAIYLYFRFWAKPLAEEEDGDSEQRELHAVDHHR